MISIALATTNEQIQRCFPVMAQLRPHLIEAQFVERVRKQQQGGYHLAFQEEDGVVKAVAGYRVLESLAWSKFLYVDDLVAAEAFRSQGCGRRLFEWLVKQAHTHGCEQFHLDSGVQRFGAHRFYLTRGMDISCHHFAMKLR